MLKFVSKINEPKDLKGLTIDELNILAEEIREGLFNRLTKIGGHFGPNFGFVEATIAMHYVFNISFWFTQDKRIKAGKKFVDVGIAEEHAVALISGIAKNGGSRKI